MCAHLPTLFALKKIFADSGGCHFLFSRRQKLIENTKFWRRVEQVTDRQKQTKKGEIIFDERTTDGSTMQTLFVT